MMNQIIWRLSVIYGIEKGFGENSSPGYRIAVHYALHIAIAGAGPCAYRSIVYDIFMSDWKFLGIFHTTILISYPYIQLTIHIVPSNLKPTSILWKNMTPNMHTLD